MWFDVKAALAEIGGEALATPATLGGETPSHVADVASPPAPKSERVAGTGRAPRDCPRALEDLTPDELDHYEERAAILEYDGGFPRHEAERHARLELVWSQSEGGLKNKPLTRLWPSKNER